MYQALYRKWRPRTFDDVVGLSHITETLKTQVSTGRLSHAYLFIGTRGTGKTTCAKILAKAVNCENPVNGNPCNRCSACLGIDDGSIMDVVEMDAASNNGVDNVRQLRDEAVFSPANARRRVYIIDEVHMLSTSAFNALLKILEEPPAHLMFILATTELNKVPATILSRCQRHSFKRLDTESIIARLQYVAQQESLDLTADAAALIAGLSEGGMRDALSMLDQCSGRDRIDTDTIYSALGLAGNREVAHLLQLIAAHNTAEVIALFSQLWQGGKDPSTLLGELSALLRDILMCAVAPKGGRELLSGGYDASTLDAFRSTFSVGALVNLISIIQDTLSEIRSGQARMRCELCLITLCEPGLSDSLPMLRERVAALERQVKNGLPAPVAPVDISLNRVAASNDLRDSTTAYASNAFAPAQAPQKAVDIISASEKGNDLPPFDVGPASVSDNRDLFPSVTDDRDAPPPPSDEDAPPFDMPFEAPRSRNAPPAAAPKTPEPPAASRQAPAPSRAAAAPPTVADGDAAFWEQLRPKLSGLFPIGISAILSDPAQVTGSYDGSVLTLAVQPGFSSNMVNRPDTVAKLAAAAAELAGHLVEIRMGQPAAEKPATPAEAGSKLDALSKFDIVKFK